MNSITFVKGWKGLLEKAGDKQSLNINFIYKLKPGPVHLHVLYYSNNFAIKFALHKNTFSLHFVFQVVTLDGANINRKINPVKYRVVHFCDANIMNS